MRRRGRSRRGSVLLFVLAVLAMMTILGATLSRSVHHRARSVQHGRRGGTSQPPHATIEKGANGAPTNEAVHGSQTFSSGGDDRLQSGADH
jgi:hypothetical protein